MATLKERKIYPKFKATAKGGRLYFEDERRFADYVASLEGVEVQVVVKKWVKQRSRQEEKFYHAVVVRMVAEAMDMDDWQAHDFLKNLFLRVEDKTDSGLRFERVLSTTELSDRAYREYWEKCIKWAALPTDGRLGYNSGLELYIPYPNEVDYTNW